MIQLKILTSGAIFTLIGTFLVLQVFLCALIYFRRHSRIPVTVQRRQTTSWLINLAFAVSFLALIFGWPTELGFNAAYFVVPAGAYLSLFIYTRWRREGPDGAPSLLTAMFVGSAFFHLILWVALARTRYLLSAGHSPRRTLPSGQNLPSCCCRL